MAYSAKIIADSISAFGKRLTTMEITIPRIILAELNTHGRLARNSASSRAIPVEKQIEKVLLDPFIPVHFGANQAGMQANAELQGLDKARAKSEWLEARDDAVSHAQQMLKLGLHKQITNRILEPFMWHTVIVTASEWDNFFALRTHKDAQPEIRKIADWMQDLYRNATPTLVDSYNWHLPYIQPEEFDGKFEHSKKVCKISAARCARVSYLTHDGKRDLEADLTLYERLVSGGHMSPLEHVAVPDPRAVHGKFIGWEQFRKFIPNEDNFALIRS